MSTIKQSLNNDDVKIILHNHYGDDNFEIIKVTSLPYFNNINGFLGQHISLSVDVKRDDKSLKEYFFAKFLPTQDSPFYEHIQHANCYNKELFFYTNFMELAKNAIENLNVRIAPKMLYSSKEILIFEDMGIQGYKSITLADVTELHVTKAMQVIAKFHAIGFAVEEYKSKSFKCAYKLIDEFPDIFNEPLFSLNVKSIPYRLSTTGRDATLDLMEFLSHKLSEDKIARFKEEYGLQFDKLMDIFFNGDQKYRRVISHGDLWLNNLLYKYDEGGKIADCLMVDFQYLRYAPPAHDVTFTIYYIANKELMREKYDHFLRVYYEHLTNELNRYGLDINDICPMEEYEKSCKMYLTIAKIIKGIYAPLCGLPQDRLNKLCSNAEDYRYYLLGDRRPLARKFMKEEPAFNDFITENLMDIYEGIFSDRIA